MGGGVYIRSPSTPSLCRSYGGQLLQSEARPAVDKQLKYKWVLKQDRKTACVTFSSLSSSLLNSFFSVICRRLCRLSTFSCSAWGGKRKTQCHQVSDGGGKEGKSLCKSGVMCKWRTWIYINLQLHLRWWVTPNPSSSKETSALKKDT